MENYSIHNNEDVFLVRNRNESIYIEFVLQAIYNPSSKEIKYYEILSRIISSSGENYNNEDFFENIDDTFLKMIAICQLKEAKRLSINKPISINLTLSCLLDTDFINELIDRKNIGLAIEINDINSNFDCDLLFENIKKL
ncbi:EAL domain-containing protein, partial [Vibrio vulnificus]|nr:EAL domain-containing protein [Vibrio vulnificus]